MDDLIARIRRLGFMVILGVCLILYAGLGFVYVQQLPKQADLQEQIDKSMTVVSKPLPNIVELREKRDEANQALAPLEISDALQVVVDIAKESGIDVDPANGNFHIPPPKGYTEKKLGEGTYQVLSLSGIEVKGSYDSVMSFISDLDLGETKKTMVLTKVDIKQTEVRLKEEEIARRAEFRDVSAAVIEMMTNNGLTEIPNPINYESGNATNNMAVFVDNTTLAAEKGYTGTGRPKAGYVLYEHDQISTDNTTEFETVSYITRPTTQYYYTCEADGTVRQFDKPDLATAIEYLSSEEVEIRTTAILHVDFYTKPIKTEG